jgi:3D-(3,5/4)-trihydroxycyclohexane-1,2-dione acylhydrolase (decyclizing)
MGLPPPSSPLQTLCAFGGGDDELAQGGFGTRYRPRNEATKQLNGDVLTVDFAANARSLGAHALKAGTLDELKQALKEAKTLDRTTVIVVETDVSASKPGYESWWDVAVAEVSEMEGVREARARYEEARKRERHHL